MPRTNSLSDSDGRSLTPDLEDEGIESAAPNYGPHRVGAFGGGAHHGVGHALTTVMSRKSHKSHHTHQTHQTHKTSQSKAAYSQWKNLTPIQRFRAAGRKVIAMSRGTSLLGDVRRIGGEPGVDPRRESANIIYGQIHEDCKIEVIDYSAVRCNYKQMGNVEFVNLMEGDQTWEPQPWVKCRWINIGGVSWDVIKALSLRYSLHPLALGDVFQKDKRSRSKADYYSMHLFLRVMSHELRDDGDDSADITTQPRSESPEPFEENSMEKGGLDTAEIDGETLHASVNAKSRQSTMRRRPLLPRTLADLSSGGRASPPSRLTELLRKDGEIQKARVERKADEAMLENLKESEHRVSVKVKPMFIFLFRDGTVITIQRPTDLENTAPISQRLRQRDSVLRTSVDHSLLVHALLDIVVDRAMEVIDEYHKKINFFERKVLLRPDMKTVKELHILSGDLILHKRTLDPIKTLIFGLRRYDIDRCAALVDMSDPANEGRKVVGYMTHKSKIYLADVYDHIDFILTSLDMFAGIGENLIDYTFNLASYEMNEVMRQLTLATIIFLPLTLLTGYFGMNFEFMWTIQHGHSDVVFWIIALPVMALVVPIFLKNDIIRMVHYVNKRMSNAKVGKNIKNA